MKVMAWGLLLLSILCLIWQVHFFNKGKNERVLMAFGDSLTYGYGDREEEGYVGRLEDKVNSTNSKENIHVWNYGVYGQETDGVLKQLDDLKIRTKLKEAESMIVFIGTNDLLNSNGGDLSPLHVNNIRKEKPVYIQHLHQILSILRKENKQAPILVLGLYNPYPANHSIEKQIDDWNHSILAETNKHTKMKYVPTNDCFKHIEKSKYFSDSLHPDKKGYDLITKKILEVQRF
jgi:lysophospholipase L1-like esterase